MCAPKRPIPRRKPTADVLRVAVDLTSLLTAQTGVGVFAVETTRRLATRDDLALTAFAVTWRGRGRLSSAVPPNVAVVERPMAARPLRALWTRADHPRIDLWIGRHDVVWGPNYVVPPTRAASVVSVHDLTPVHFPQLATADTLAYPRLIQRALDRGAWVQTSSSFVRNEVIDHFRVDPDRVVSIPLGVRPVAPGDAGAGQRLVGGDRYVLAVGTVEPRKDLPTLVRAFDLVGDGDRDVRLVLAGQDGWGAEALDLAIRGSRHRERIVRLGWVSDHDREALLRGASVYAYPSIYEGFGFPPLEAMSADVPVVTTETGSLPEVVGSGADLVPVGDAKALAESLSRVLADDDHRRELVARGREAVARHSWDTTAERFAALLRRVAGTR
jgi:glycosyltransferase involved in cell wall biosynthesis